MNNFLIKVLKKVNAFKFFNFSISRKFGGKKFVIPVSDNIGYSNLSTSEPWMLHVLKVVLPIKNGHFIDVGVNTGQTLLKLKSVAPKVNYIGFEPNPFCVNYVGNLIALNGFKNTIIVPVGISDKTEIGELNFIDDSKADSSASMIAEFRKNSIIKRHEYIPLFKVEDLNASINLDNISVLKIDVEGAELEVLTSFKKHILNCKPIILLEILPVYPDNYSFMFDRQSNVLKLLSELDYSMFRVVKKKDMFAGFEAIFEIENHTDLSKCDYVMVHKSKVADFKALSTQVFNV